MHGKGFFGQHQIRRGRRTSALTQNGGSRMSRRTVVAAIGAAAVAVGGAIGGVLAASSSSSISLSANSHREHHSQGMHMMRGPREMRMAGGWSFSKLNDDNDPTFNQLLGIN